MNFTYIILFGNHRNTIGLVLVSYCTDEEFQRQPSYLTCRNWQVSHLGKPDSKQHAVNLSEIVTYRLESQNQPPLFPETM